MTNRSNETIVFEMKALDIEEEKDLFLLSTFLPLTKAYNSSALTIQVSMPKAHFAMHDSTLQFTINNANRMRRFTQINLL